MRGHMPTLKSIMSCEIIDSFSLYFDADDQFANSGKAYLKYYAASGICVPGIVLAILLTESKLVLNNERKLFGCTYYYYYVYVDYSAKII